MTTPTLVEVVVGLEAVFDRVGLRRSYGGAIAYNYYAPPRLTLDVDVLVLTSDLKMPALVEELAAVGCQRGHRQPEPLALRAVLDDVRGRDRMTVLDFRGVRVDVFTPWHPFHRRVLDRSPERAFDGRTIRIHAAEDLIVLKKVFDRPKDLMDIRAMLLAQRDRLDLARLRADAAELLPSESLAELDALIAQSA